MVSQGKVIHSVTLWVCSWFLCSLLPQARVRGLVSIHHKTPPKVPSSTWVQNGEWTFSVLWQAVGTLLPHPCELCSMHTWCKTPRALVPLPSSDIWRRNALIWYSIHINHSNYECLCSWGVSIVSLYGLIPACYVLYCHIEWSYYCRSRVIAV